MTYSERFRMILKKKIYTYKYIFWGRKNETITPNQIGFHGKGVKIEKTKTYDNFDEIDFNFFIIIQKKCFTRD